ncbi:MAG: ribonuclease III [Candidatus Pacebacteria bacterium]|nr:ribonuclease III [Candidatus Paceibacterota bacterium]
MIDFSKFEEKVGISFKDKGLLTQAFVHRSYINENKDAGLDHNERLEFLGDAVLELITTEHLFSVYKQKPEGELTSYRAALVNAQTLSQVGTNLGINDFLLLSRGEAKDTGRARQYIIANTIEALIGALYLDQGYESAQKFVTSHIFPLIEELIEQKGFVDSKSLFQEKAQEEDGITPSYKVIKESGPDHDKDFVVGVFLNDKKIASGEGSSKQSAEQDAAKNALVKKGWS